MFGLTLGSKTGSEWEDAASLAPFFRWDFSNESLPEADAVF